MAGGGNLSVPFTAKLGQIERRALDGQITNQDLRDLGHIARKGDEVVSTEAKKLIREIRSK